jgi:hypothetical protein
MKPVVSTHLRSIVASVAGLAERPRNLFFILFALDALFQPYVGVWHDAQLYAVQVLNRLEAGAFSNDLFFLYGSQDSYSLFSLVMAPLARVLGLLPSFFLVYLAGRALFLYGAMRLVRVLIPDARAAVIALIFLTICNIPYGGGVSAFHVNERFLTPRLLATGLVLLGLEQMLCRRGFRAVGLLVLAFVLHPLMACGGLLVFVLWSSYQLLPWRWLLALASLAAFVAAGVLLYQPLGLKLFGHMDDRWRDLIMRRSPHCFPALWEVADWLQIGSSLIILLAAAWHLPRPLAIFCAAVAGAGALGLAGAFLAAELPYALLLQGQPFRALWLAQLLASPLGFFLASRWAADPRPTMRLLAILLVTALLQQFVFDARTIFVLLAAFPACALWYRRFRADTRDWLELSLLSSILIGFCLRFLINVAAVAAAWDGLLREFEPLHLAGAVASMFDKALLFVAALLLACAADRRTELIPFYWLGTRLRFAAALILFGVTYQALHFGLPEAEWYRRAFRKDHENVRFVAQVLARQSTPGRHPTLYWAADINCLWLDLRVNCYFHPVQTPNSIFSRGEALEGDRRARLVARFEVEKMRGLRLPGKEVMADWEWQLLLAHVHAAPDEPPPCRADLVRLCRQQDLDYVVTRSFLGPDYSATNGQVFVYEARAAAVAKAATTQHAR